MLRISVNTCRSLSKLNIKQVNNTNRSIHLVCRARHAIVKSTRAYDPYNSKILSTLFIRHASTSEATVANTEEAPVFRIDLTPNASAIEIDQLPEIPDIPTPVQEVVETLHKLHPNGEETFQSLGLGGYGPIGLVQNAFEWLHISCDMPWWGVIAIGTIVVRLAIFPFMIQSQIHASKFAKHMPKLQQLQERATTARLNGDQYEAAVASAELYAFMKDKKVTTWGSMKHVILQAPVFISFFMALRGMANLPVESLKTGGLWWFTDLTVPDPYYILPVLMCTTLFITIELGTENLSTTSKNIKIIMRLIPLVLLPSSVNFPTAIVCYWTMTNFISLLQASLLRIPQVRKTLNLPKMVKPALQPANANNKGFITNLKESWENMKITKQLAEREHTDYTRFSNAGRGPIIKTFKENPTKFTTKQSVVKAKKNN